MKKGRLKERRLDFADDLDDIGCATCGRTARDCEIYIHSRCHWDRPTWTSYRGGVLTIRCAACGRVVRAVAVARRGQAP